MHKNLIPSTPIPEKKAHKSNDQSPLRLPSDQGLCGHLPLSYFACQCTMQPSSQQFVQWPQECFSSSVLVSGFGSSSFASWSASGAGQSQSSSSFVVSTAAGAWAPASSASSFALFLRLCLGLCRFFLGLLQVPAATAGAALSMLSDWPCFSDTSRAGEGLETKRELDMVVLSVLGESTRSPWDQLIVSFVEGGNFVLFSKSKKTQGVRNLSSLPESPYCCRCSRCRCGNAMCRCDDAPLRQ
ncbi:hypothetical protein FN846DRAFT_968627 [Sphaerosporella brunnea]|uniref:Uncharacterized protein n=1 Tax=Sphaerosporella brunnea TaxID=1250544 RepID=A0A5J5EIZ7_9PEZI|nr:hypothetical protein FN846DRAFT_968627 [Sphaerosporella brunnea]